MALKTDDEVIGTKPSGRLIREFRTELPNPSLASVQRFAGSLSDLGGDMMKGEADKAVKEAVASAPSKDGNGNYVIPDVPEGFGSYGTKLFSDAVETRYRNNVFQDFQAAANRIAADPANATNPDRALEMLRAEATGRLKGTDPRVAADLESYFVREVNERHRSIVNVNAGRDYSLEVGRLTEQRTWMTQRLQDAYAVGKVEEAQEWERQIDATTNQLVGMRAESPRSAPEAEAAKRGNRFAGTIIGAVNRAVTAFNKGDASALSTDMLNTLHGMTVGMGGDESVTVGGLTLTRKQVMEEINNPQLRGLLANRIALARSDLAGRLATSTETQAVGNINKFYDENPAAAGFPRNVSPELAANAVETWAKATGNDWRTPQGYQLTVNRYGEVPKKLYEDFFSNAKFKTVEQLEAARPLYEQMQTTMGRDGRRTDMTDVLKREDDALMWHYTTLRGKNEGLPAAEAADLAKKAVERGLTRTTAGEGMKMLTGYLGEQYAGMKVGSQQYHEWVKSRTELDMSKAPDAAKTFFAQTAAAFVASDVPLDKAVDLAAKHYKANWGVSPYALEYAQGGKSGVSPKAFHIPALPTPDGSSGYDYLQPLVDKALEQASPDQYNGVPSPFTDLSKTTDVFDLATGAKIGEEPANGGRISNYKVGENVFLKQIGTDARSPVYQLWYAEGDGRATPIMKPDNTPLTIHPKRYIDEQSAFARGGMVERARSVTEAEAAMKTDPTVVGAAPPKVERKFLDVRPEHVMPPETVRMMLERGAEPTPSLDKKKRTSLAPIDRALEFVGVNETEGRATLTAFFKSATGQAVDPQKTAWCATFANSVLRSTGHAGTNSNMARSFLAYGQPAAKPDQGDIVVFRRGKDNVSGHVGFFVGTEKRGGKDVVLVLGGNQSGEVSVQAYPAADVLGVRRVESVDKMARMPGMEDLS